MKKAENISLFCYLLSVSAGLFPVLDFLCLNGLMNRTAVLCGVFILNGLAAVLNRITLKKYSRILPKIYSFILTATAFFISPDAPFFYRTSTAVIVLILSTFMHEKREDTITGIYTFILITFADIVFGFITAYTFPQTDTTSQLFFYLAYALCFFIMTYTRSAACFFKGSKGRIQAGIILFSVISITAAAMLSFPLAQLAAKGIKSLLRLVFSNAGGGNTNPPMKAEADMTTAYDELSVSHGGPVVRYIILGICAAFTVFMIVFLRREIAAFIRRLPMKLCRRKIPSEKIAIYEEYTDFISDITKSDTVQSSVNVNKIWQKKLKAYRRMKWSEEKMRAGLELAQNRLMLSGIEIKDCDTVLDIEKKLPQNIKPLWHTAAICYMNCRYDKAVPDKSDEEIFERLIHEIIKNSKGDINESIGNCL